MITLNKEKFEKEFGVIIQTNKCSLGCDTASRTGWCIAKTTNKNITLDFGIISIKTTDVDYKYNHMINWFKVMLRDLDASIVVIEDTFYGKNVKTLKMISRIGMIVYTLCTLQKIPKYFILAVQARKKLNLPSNKKKAIVHAEFSKRLPEVKIKDVDVIDSIILAINGLIKEPECPLGIIPSKN